MQTIIKALAVAIIAATPLVFAAPVSAQGVFVSPQISGEARAPLRGPRANIARQLRFYGYRNVDVSRLSNGQVAHINSLLHSGRSHGDITGMIGATLRRGPLQRGVDRVLR